MNKELQKRILTSILLISLIILCLYMGHPVIVFTIFLVSCIAFNEFQKLLHAAYPLSSVQKFLTLILSTPVLTSISPPYCSITGIIFSAIILDPPIG